jgi:hypothetical protein
MKQDYLTDDCQRLRDRPSEDRLSCPSHHRYMIVEITPERLLFRCERCLRYLESLRRIARGDPNQNSLF